VAWSAGHPAPNPRRTTRASVIPDGRPLAPPTPRASDDLESTTTLLARARQGDDEALNSLYSRYLQPLTRWARGRLPVWARDLRETDDLVQDALTQTLRNIHQFDPAGQGALYGYLRQAVLNKLRDEVRRVSGRRVEPIDEHGHLPAQGLSPLEEVLGRDLLAAYDRALERLPEDDQEAVIARIEMGASYAEIAQLTGKSSPDAARMAVSRALLKIAAALGHARR
jgi:RNA polymerase sigma factor (sigma-70 family)